MKSAIFLLYSSVKDEINYHLVILFCKVWNKPSSYHTVTVTVWNKKMAYCHTVTVTVWNKTSLLSYCSVQYDISYLLVILFCKEWNSLSSYTVTVTVWNKLSYCYTVL